MGDIVQYLYNSTGYREFVFDRLRASGLEHKDFVDYSGADFIFERKNDKRTVCIKCIFTDVPIGKFDLDELKRVAKLKECDSCMLITNNTIDNGIREYAQKKRIIIKDNFDIPEPLRKYQIADSTPNNSDKLQKDVRAIRIGLGILLTIIGFFQIYGCEIKGTIELIPIK